ncbi:MAG: biotin--[acetyl-CoA-carboxylase] ligase [Desulfococcaceae bacterium]
MSNDIGATLSCAWKSGESFMKAGILNQLKSASDVVSGEALSAGLGTSRVTVWKHIQKLQELGYEIESTPKGYRLLSSPDIPYPWEIPGREATLHYFPETTSTMDNAREMARNGCPHFTTVAAGRQTQGRGRLQRTWLSDDGGLYFTVVIRPDIPPVLASRINFAASLTLAEVLNESYRVEARVKWPNDLLVDEKKITGMLSEMEVDADMVSFVNIGMGINVNNDPASAEPAADSLHRILGRKISRKELLAEFLDRFEDRMARLDYDTVVEEWKAYTLTLNRKVRIITTSNTHEGRAVDVAPDGALILEQADGAIRRVLYGDCFLDIP